MTERTVVRDRAAVRKAGAVEPGRQLGDELLGEMQRLTLASVQRLTRLAQERDAPAYARLWSEEAITRTYKRFMETANRLGYLEDGTLRLNQIRAMDPAEQRRRVERLKRDHQAMLAVVGMGKIEG